MQRIAVKCVTSEGTTLLPADRPQFWIALPCVFKKIHIPRLGDLLKQSEPFHSLTHSLVFLPPATEVQSHQPTTWRELDSFSPWLSLRVLPLRLLLRPGWEDHPFFNLW